MPRKPMSAEKAMERLEDLCARSEQASGELMQKLRRWGISIEKSEEIIESLKKRRFVDDRRFAGAYVRDKVLFARWGRMKIMRGLMEKRVARDIIDDALCEIDIETYTENLRHLAKTKIAANPDLSASYEGRTKLFRFLASRGYESSLAARVLKEVLLSKAL